MVDFLEERKWNMQNSLPNIQNYFTYYHLTLFSGEIERYMGRVNHLQVIELDDKLNHPGISHSVRFYDGSNHRELLGIVCTGENGLLVLDMGHGKSYRFKRHDN
jgi:hypothetical protein